MSTQSHEPAGRALRAVILDWAGTTVDYGSRAPPLVFVQVFTGKGVPISVEEARGPMGMQKHDHIRTLTREPAIARRWEQVHGRPPGEADIDEMYEAFLPLQLAVLGDYTDLIPGLLEAQEGFRRRGLLIGSNTGYNRAMTDILLAAAQRQGYRPDATVCADDVPAGRPAPWMALRLAEGLNVFPMRAIVKIGDTVADIQEGRNAGMWTIGVALTGNELGLSAEEAAVLSPAERNRAREKAAARLYAAGADYVVDGVGETLPVIDKINSRWTAQSSDY